MDLNSKQYFELNETASLVWRCLSKGMPVGDIAIEMTALYDVTMERAQSSVQTVVDRFIAHRLLNVNSLPRDLP